MIPKILIVVAAVSSVGYSAPSVYEASAVFYPEAQEAGEINEVIASTINLLPELSAALTEISSKDGGSDPSSIFDVVSSFMPLTRQALTASDSLRNNPTPQAELQKIEMAEQIIPAVSTFVDSMRALGGNTGTTSFGQNRPSNLPTGELQLDTTRSDDRMVETIVDILPDIANTFKQINNDPGRDNPNDPEFTNRVIMAFLPLTEKALKATARAEGRPVRQEELNQLKRIDRVMPAITKFIKSLSDIDFQNRQTSSFSSSSGLPTRFETPAPATLNHQVFPVHTSQSNVKPLNLPTRFETPEPATFEQPAFPVENLHSLNHAFAVSSHISQPSVTYVLKTPETSSTPLKSPSYPEATHILPQGYQAFIPTVPQTISGLPAYYSFSTLYGR